MKPLLQISDLRVSLGGVGYGKAPTTLLHGVDLDIRPGQVHGLVGESGAGKTLVAKTVLGILPPAARVDAGQVLFDGRNLLTLAARQRRQLAGRQIALIPQDPMSSLNPVRRVGAQIHDVLRLQLKLARREAKQRTLALLEQVQIRDPQRVYAQYPFELSGGMRQRALIAIAFACQPQLIVADEPTTALDVTVQRQILRLIRALARDANTALLFVTHDLGVVAKLCDEVSVIRAGRIVEHAPTAQLFERPQHAYTQALFAATPRYDRPGQLLRALPPKASESLP